MDANFKAAAIAELNRKAEANKVLHPRGVGAPGHCIGEIMHELEVISKEWEKQRKEA